MDIYAKLGLSILTFGVFVLASQFGIPAVLRRWRKDVEKFIEDNLKKLRDEKYKYLADIEKTVGVGSGKFIFERADRLGYLTRIVGVGELLFFATLTVLLLKNNLTVVGGGDIFFKFFGGWLAIKTLTNYDQWSHVIAGKAYLYISLFGTFMSIFLSFLLGYIIYWLGVF